MLGGASDEVIAASPACIVTDAGADKPIGKCREIEGGGVHDACARSEPENESQCHLAGEGRAGSGLGIHGSFRRDTG